MNDDLIKGYIQAGKRSFPKRKPETGMLLLKEKGLGRVKRKPEMHAVISVGWEAQKVSNSLTMGKSFSSLEV